MLNPEEIITRLHHLMTTHQMNAAAFAEKIGVQRSLLSHVLSGRNKPSLEFLSKVEESFHEVDFIWLIKGEKIPPSPALSSTVKTTSSSIPTTESQEKVIEPKNILPSNDSLNQAKSIQKNQVPEKIVHYFQDGSFEVFHKR